MIPYLFLLFVPSMFALFNSRRLSLSAWYITFFIYVLFVGLRFDVGPDAYQYGYIHHSLNYLSFGEVISRTEPLSYLLFWISETSGQHVYLSNIVAAIVTIGGVFAFARRTANPWLALIAATPYFIIVMGMSGVRQAMAAGIMLFLLSRWEKYSFVARSGSILVSALFHTSALVNTIFLVIQTSIPLRYKIVLGALILALTIYVSLGVSVYGDNLLLYQQRYLGGSSAAQSVGALYHIALVLIPALLAFYYRRRILDGVHNIPLLYFGLYSVLAVVLIHFVSSTVASRLTIYLYFIPMMVYPALVATVGRRSWQASVFAVVIFHFCVLISWFQFANVSLAYIPYKNLLFDD